MPDKQLTIGCVTMLGRKEKKKRDISPLAPDQIVFIVED